MFAHQQATIEPFFFSPSRFASCRMRSLIARRPLSRITGRAQRASNQSNPIPVRFTCIVVAISSQRDPAIPWISEAYHPIPKRLSGLWPLGHHATCTRVRANLAWLPKKKTKRNKESKTSVRRPSVRGCFCVRALNQQVNKVAGCQGPEG